MLMLMSTPIHRSITITITIILVSLRSINQSIDRSQEQQPDHHHQTSNNQQQTTKSNIEWFDD